jgi:hypothetical protein
MKVTRTQRRDLARQFMALEPHLRKNGVCICLGCFDMDGALQPLKGHPAGEDFFAAFKQWEATAERLIGRSFLYIPGIMRGAYNFNVPADVQDKCRRLWLSRWSEGRPLPAIKVPE